MNKKSILSILATLCSVVGVFFLATGCKGETGPQGIQGEKGDTGIGITSIVKIHTVGETDTYEIRFSDDNITTFTIQNGVDGIDGENGVGIRTASIDQNGELILILTDNRTIRLGKVTGEKGEQGDDAVHANEKHTVTYAPNGGKLPNGAEMSVIVDYGDTLDLPVPTRENYTFEGWYTGDTFNDGKFTTVTPVTKTITLTARWTPNISYRLMYETNGGNGIAPTTHYFDETITSLPEPVKYDCSFIGWYQDEDLTTPVGYPLTLTENTAVYAKWTTSYYFVNFHTNCSETMDAQYVSAGTSFENFSAPENEMFSFAGWYLDSGFTQMVEYPFVIHADTELFAKWNDVYRTFSFISNGGTQIEAQQYRAGIGLDSLPIPTRWSYHFNGWYEDSALTTPVTFPYKITDDKILYAKWTWYDPYADYTKIYDIVQFQQITDLNGKYLLMNDLDFENETLGQFGSPTLPFTGIFDGQGHTVSNIVLENSGTHYGLFAINNGTITNVKFENISQSVTHDSNFYAGLLTAENNGTISKVSLNGILQVKGANLVHLYAGLITATNNGQINNCSVGGKIEICQVDVKNYIHYYIGSICSTNLGKIANCLSSVSLSNIGSEYWNYLYLGGIVWKNGGEIQNVIFIGSIVDGASSTGAISATTVGEATEKQCYEYSNATGGTSITVSYLNSSSLYVDTLGWDTSIWDLSLLDYENGLYAKLY